MTRARSICRRLRLLTGRSEQGIALPTALFATIAALALGGVAVMSSIDVQHGTTRDSGSKSAIAAADAGANVATMRLKRDSAELASASCLDGAEAEAGGWCPPVTGTVGGAEYSYQVSAAGTACGEFALCVVASGTAKGVTRRVEITFNEGPGGSGSSGSGGSTESGESGGSSSGGGGVEGMIGQDGIDLSGNADIRVGIGTNGDIVSSGNTSICGDIRHGIGKQWTTSGNASQCSGYEVTEGNQDLPPVSSFMPSDIATHNSNNRITVCSSPGNPPECEADTYNGQWSSTAPFNSSNRRITLAGNTTLTVGGGDYWVCSISLSGNSELIMAAGAHVRFFFDTPENCGVTTQISLSGNNRISATGYQPGESQFDMPGFYLLGSPTIATQVDLSGNYSTTDEFVIYGPNTNINISGNATFKGVVAGKRIAMSGNGKFEQDAGFELEPSLNPWESSSSEPSGGSTEPTEPDGAPYYTAQYYVECSGPASPAPDAGC
jgi:hypothetical protein